MPSPARGRPASACWSASIRSPARRQAVRAAKRIADRLEAELIALYVETDAPRHACREAERDRLAETLRLAEQLGAEVVTVPGPLGGRGDPGLRPRAQRHPDRGRQVAALALVRAAPRLGGRRAGAQRLGPQRSRWRRRATRRRRPARPTGCSSVPLHAGSLPRGRADRRRSRRRSARLIDASIVGCPISRWSSWCRCWSRRRATGSCRRSGSPALSVLCLQLLLPAAALHIHHRRSRERRGAGLLHVRRGRWPARWPRARARRPRRRGARRARPPSSTPSAARSPASSSSTICCGSWSPISPDC